MSEANKGERILLKDIPQSVRDASFIVATDDCYYLGVWTIELHPLVYAGTDVTEDGRKYVYAGGDWMMCAWRWDDEPRTYHIDYRFRRYVDEKVWGSNDVKTFYSMRIHAKDGLSGESFDASVLQMCEDMVLQIRQMAGMSAAWEHVDVHGYGDVLMTRLRSAMKTSKFFSGRSDKVREDETLEQSVQRSRANKWSDAREGWPDDLGQEGGPA